MSEKININKETLFLSDDLVFYTIEGEGEFIGQPSVFNFFKDELNVIPLQQA